MATTLHTACAKVAVLWLDSTGLPRAFASGPAEKLKEVRKVALANLTSYRKAKAEVDDTLNAFGTYSEKLAQLDKQGKTLSEEPTGQTDQPEVK